jgi:WD40 repeat protein
MKLWSTKKASLTRDFGERKNTTTEVMKILPNNKDLFINGKDNNLYQYNISNGNLIRDLGQAHKYWISAMESTPDSKYLFTGSFSSLKQWDCTTGALVKDYGSVHNTYIQCMAMTHDGKFLYTGGKSGMIKVIDVDAQTAREFRFDIATPGKPLLPFLLVLRFVVMSGRWSHKFGFLLSWTSQHFWQRTYFPDFYSKLLNSNPLWLGMRMLMVLSIEIQCGLYSSPYRPMIGVSSHSWAF